ncbi:carboxymuconolactone decarboxylase family protein [Dactylosporangium sp. CS-033363]|uniref:carboxymuconolactone decarboxylase family protein n=1 Tax=Dactylosporangium sp. CS-033363 TaxID=3239935 RepID=UPI003D8A8FE5
MRIRPIPPDELGPQLREVHDGIASLVKAEQDRVVILDDDGALVGPFAAMLHFPTFGVPALMLQRAVAAEARLDPVVREVAILTVGAAYGARYVLYAHEQTADQVGLAPEHVATLAAGGRPPGLTAEQAVAHDVAAALTGGRILPGSTYERAVRLLGHDGVGELAFLIGSYCLIAVAVNCFDVPVPDRAPSHPSG